VPRDPAPQRAHSRLRRRARDSATTQGSRVVDNSSVGTINRAFGPCSRRMSRMHSTTSGETTTMPPEIRRRVLIAAHPIRANTGLFR
jgi:hypothetical protein